MITATCCLHNLVEMTHEEFEDRLLEPDPDYAELLAAAPVRAPDLAADDGDAAALRTRDRIAEEIWRRKMPVG